jgi:hypothetical protein
VSKRVLAFADDHHVHITDLTTGAILSTHLIEPNKTYWRNQMQEPGRWPTPKNGQECGQVCQRFCDAGAAACRWVE